MEFESVLKNIKTWFKKPAPMTVNEGLQWTMASLDLLPNPFFLVDYSEKRVIFSNAAARKMLGLDYANLGIAELYGKELTCFDAHGNLVAIHDIPSARVARGENVDGEEFLLSTPSGTYNIKVFTGKIPSMFNRPAMGLILLQDITALKASEKSLLQTQTDLNEAVDIAQVGFWSVDTSTMKTMLSPHLMVQFGIEPHEFDGELETIVARIDPEDRPRVVQAIESSIANGSPYKMEFRVPLPGGVVRWIEAKSGSNFNSGNKNRFAGTTLDITERVNARITTEANEKELRLLADSMPQIVWSADSTGQLDYFNRVWFDYSGSTYDDNVGNKWAQYVHPEDLPTTAANWQKSIETSRPYENEFRLRKADGSYCWFVARARPIFEEGSTTKVKKWYGTNTDIHEQKLMAEKLKEAKFSAERANLAKSQFLANMSHEIRTPLGAIMGFSELLKENGLGRTQRDEFVSVIERNSFQLLRIVDDILDLSKVEAGMMLIENIEFSLLELLTDFSSLMGFKAREKGIRFSSRAATPLPSMINSDPTRIRQILMNVVGNAIKFTDKGHVDLRIKFENGILGFEIEDTGRGISKEQESILFQPFTQADASTTRKYGGTGLGLSLTRSLTEAMGGSFDLMKSELGKGSTFRVQVKADANPNAKMFTGLGFETTPSRSVVSTGQLAGARVLIVEDSPDNQALISIYLNRAGAVVDIASDGELGYKMAMSSEYDVVLMDVQMPIMDGIAAVRKLRTEGYKKPILALTAHAMKEERERCLEAGFSEFITKPVNRDELINEILNSKN